MKQYLDVDELNELTKLGFAFFEDAFDYPYPFGKYDQLYVPEYNMGAMENAGCVTFRDEYLPRSRQVHAFYESRANTILHEMAHMWFGDLVTMKWWDDLWLNESFAEWAAHHAMVNATQYTEAWTGFTNARKNWAYRQDQLPSTHPIAADNYDLQAVEVNFDGITYAKGASTLKQLVAWVGIDRFLAGLRDYFKANAFGNSEFADLLGALEKASGRELDSWASEWLQTSGVNTLAPVFDVDADGGFTSFSISQTAAPEFPIDPPAPNRRRPLRPGRRSAGPAYVGRDRRRRRVDRRPRAWSVRSSPTWSCSTTVTSPTPRSAWTSGPWPRRSTTSTRSTTRWRGHCLGRGLGHDPRRRDERHRLRGAGPAGLGTETDLTAVSRLPGLRPQRRQLLRRSGRPRRAQGHLGDRAARAAGVGRSPVRTTSWRSPGRTPRPRTPTTRWRSSPGCSTAPSPWTAWRSTPTCAGHC